MKFRAAVSVTAFASLVACSTAAIDDSDSDSAVANTKTGLSECAVSLGSEVDRARNAYSIPGIALAVVSRSEDPLIVTRGLRQRSSGDELDENTVLPALSWTKFIFAAWVVEQSQQGSIDLDAPISDYLAKPLPEYERYGDLKGDETWKSLTLRHILSHTTGFPNFRFFPPGGPDFDRTAPLKFYRSPGNAYGYSGEGYQLAQLVGSEALEANIGQIIDREFFAAHGLTRSGARWSSDWNDNAASTYLPDGEEYGPDRRPEFDAAGSISTSILDAARLVQLFLKGDLISDSARSALLSPQIEIRSPHQFPPITDEVDPDLARSELAAGLGVVLFSGPQGRGFFKGGHFEGADNMLVCLIEQDRCALVMMNQAKGHLSIPQLVEAAIGPTGLPWHWEYAQIKDTRTGQ